MIVEDDPQVSASLRTGLLAHSYRVIECGTATDALRMARTESPDLLLLDLNLPDLDGMRVVVEIRERSSLPIIVVSARALEREKVQALDSGANDYLTKPFGFEELLARMRNALRHTARAKDQPQVFRTGGLEVDLARRHVALEGSEVKLTTIEFKLLAELVANAGKVMTHSKLLDRVWGPNNHDQVQYLRVYMGHLRRKLEPNPVRPKLFLTEAGVGYRLRVDDPQANEGSNEGTFG
ncbi:MAG: response regulator [Deltaproteobacteria bacterium]|nr:response regulator [Deltaproteobacteria bacterium]